LQGILERLRAFRRYFEKHPDRCHLDVFYQVAAISRADVSAYEQYQQECRSLCKQINEAVRSVTPDTRLDVLVLDERTHPQVKRPSGNAT